MTTDQLIKKAVDAIMAQKPVYFLYDKGKLMAFVRYDWNGRPQYEFVTGIQRPIDNELPKE